MKNSLKRKFSTSQGEMLNNGYSVAYAVKRDIDLFSSFNINSARVDSFKNLLDNYSSYPSDQTLLNAQMVATNFKNDARKSLISEIRVLRTCAGLVLGEGSSEYYYFRFDKMAHITDDNLLSLVDDMVTQAAINLEVLSVYGFNQIRLDNFKVMIDNYRDAVKAVNQKVMDRDSATKTRTILANQVYDEFKVMCEIGKVIWFDEADAHYNDYVFSESSTNTDTDLDEETDTGGDSNGIEGNG